MAENVAITLPQSVLANMPTYSTYSTALPSVANSSFIDSPGNGCYEAAVVLYKKNPYILSMSQTTEVIRLHLFRARNYLVVSCYTLEIVGVTFHYIINNLFHSTLSC